MLGVWLGLYFRVGNLVMNYIEDEELLTKRELIEEIISSVALGQSVLRKGLKVKRTEMSVKSLSVFSKFASFLSI